MPDEAWSPEASDPAGGVARIGTASTRRRRARYCFQVLALDGEARGLSSLQCTGVRG